MNVSRENCVSVSAVFVQMRAPDGTRVELMYKFEFLALYNLEVDVSKLVTAALWNV